MFGRVPQTEFDLQFPVLGIPVRVHPLFWLMGAIMGFSPGWAQAMGVNVLGVICLWWMVIFISILVHELGHALVAEFFGWRSNIVLYHFGGLAYYDAFRGHTPWKRIAVSIAGPGAGFILAGFVIAFQFAATWNGWFEGSVIYEYLIGQLLFVNIGWGLVNLLPVYPLDGGQICREVLVLLKTRNPPLLSNRIGMFVGGFVGLVALNFGMTYAGLMFLFLAFSNYQATQPQNPL
ncbi:MAG: site-2 protease family protein [Planctomycetaceae bacterium]